MILASIHSYSIVFSIIFVIASLILFKKTKKASTFIITLGCSLVVITGFFQTALLYFDIPRNLLKSFIWFSHYMFYVSSPLISIGFLIYAIKLKND